MKFLCFWSVINDFVLLTTSIFHVPTDIVVLSKLRVSFSNLLKVFSPLNFKVNQTQ